MLTTPFSESGTKVIKLIQILIRPARKSEVFYIFPRRYPLSLPANASSRHAGFSLRPSLSVAPFQKIFQKKSHFICSLSDYRYICCRNNKKENENV